MNLRFLLKKKKSAYFIAALLLTASSIVSCGLGERGGAEETSAFASSGGQTEPSSDKAESVLIHTGDPDNPVWAEAYLRSLPEKDFGGATFFISSADVVLLDKNENAYLSDVIYARNRATEEKYNVSIALGKADSASMIEEITNANLAGMNYANVCCIPMGDVGAFVAGGHLMNLRSLSAFDPSAEYFNSTSVNALSAGYKTYGIAGEASPAALDASAVFFNKDLLRAIGGAEAEQSLFDSAEKGTFTWDALYKYAAMASGYEGAASCASLGGSTAEAIHTSIGGKITNSGALKTPTVAFTADDLAGTITHMRTIKELSASAGIPDDPAAASDAFTDGNVLFTFGSLRKIQSLSSEKFAIGVLPMPKASADGEIRSLVGRDALVMTVPQGSGDVEMASLVMSALNASSYGYVTEKYVDYLHLTVLSDSRSADMLELIAKSATYDLSTAFGEAHPDISAGTVELIRKVSEYLDYSGYDSLVSAAEYDMAVSFPCSN